MNPKTQLNQKVNGGFIFQSTAFWQMSWAGLSLDGLGQQTLLAAPVAFFASRQCSGTAIRAAMSWALQQAKTRQTVISGFHSPLEQSVLKVLLQARSPVVAVLARPVVGAKLPREWRLAIKTGHMAVVSNVAVNVRMTSEAARLRNHTVALLASSVIVAHASVGGMLATQREEWDRLDIRVSALT
jgi:predicted Rossmann fold nucleotide-binding protein DprA/Smf involved in DNA uptake